MHEHECSWCWTHVFGFLWWFVVILVERILSKSWSWTKSKLLRNESGIRIVNWIKNYFTLLNLIIFIHVIFGIRTILVVFSSVYSYNLAIETLTLEAKGWGVDLVAAYLQTCFFIHYCKFCFQQKQRGTSNHKSYFFFYYQSFWYFFIAALELWYWIPMIQEYSKNHCFIDGFIDISTLPGQYFTIMILVFYVLFLIQIWHFWILPNKEESKTIPHRGLYLSLGVVISLILFYNIALGLSFCYTALHYQMIFMDFFPGDTPVKKA